MGGKWAENPPLTPPLSHFAIPLRHPTSPPHFAKAMKDRKLRGMRGYEGQASGGGLRKSTPNPSYYKDM